MAANITAGTFTNPSNDGKTWQSTLSGGTGTGYSPASGVTGITVKILGIAAQQASATISGTTITVTLAVIACSTDTVTVDVSAASNITDSGANTAQGQTGITATNTSTAVVGTNVASDLMNSSGPYGFASKDTWSFNANLYNFGRSRNVEVSTVVAGTDCWLALNQNSGNTYQVSIDGGAYANIPNPNPGVDTIISIFSGLSDTAHTVTFKHVTGSVNACLFLNPTGKFTARVKGATPSITAPSDYGPQYDIASTNSPFTKIGEWVAQVAGQDDYTYTNFEGSIKFRSSAPRFRLWVQDHPFIARLLIDGQDSILLRSSNTDSIMRWAIDVTGLDTSTTHEYQIHVTGGDTNSCAIRSIMFVGGDLSPTPAPARSQAVGAIGDSILVAQANTNGDASVGFLHQLAVGNGWELYNYTYNGSTVQNMNDGNAARTTYCGVNPTHVERLLRAANTSGVTMRHVFTNYGHNDRFFNPNNPQAYIAAVTQFLNYLFLGTRNVIGTNFGPGSTASVGLAGLPPYTTVHYIGFVQTTVDNAYRNTWNTYLAQAIAACAYPSRVRLIIPDRDWASAGYNPASAVDSTDGTHQTAVGFAKQTPFVLAENNYGRVRRRGGVVRARGIGSV